MNPSWQELYALCDEWSPEECERLGDAMEDAMRDLQIAAARLKAAREDRGMQ